MKSFKLNLIKNNNCLMNNCNSKILFNRKQKKRIKIHIRNWRCLKKIRFLQEWNFLVQKEKFKKSIFNNRR